MDVTTRIQQLHKSITPKSEISAILWEITNTGAIVSSVVVPISKILRLPSSIGKRRYKNGAMVFYSTKTGLVTGLGIRTGMQVLVRYWDADLGTVLGGIGNTRTLPIGITTRATQLLSMAKRLQDIPTTTLDCNTIMQVASEYDTLPNSIEGILMTTVVLPTEAGYCVNPKYILEGKISRYTMYVTPDTIHTISTSNSMLLSEIEFSGLDVILYCTITGKNYKVVIEGGVRTMTTPITVVNTISKFYTLKKGSVLLENREEDTKIDPEEKKRIRAEFDKFYRGKQEAKTSELKKAINDRDRAIEQVIAKYTEEKKKIQASYSKDIESTKDDKGKNKLRADRDEEISKLSLDKATAIESIKAEYKRKEAHIRDKYQSELDKKVKEYKNAIEKYGVDMYRDVKNSIDRGINSNPFFQ